MSEIDGQTSMLEQAQDRASEAVSRAEAHADPGVLDYWERVVWGVARRKPSFSTNAVFELEAVMAGGGQRFVEPRAMGVVMRRAQRAGIIRPTDRYEPDTTPGSHARPKRIWKSLICREET